MTQQIAHRLGVANGRHHRQAKRRAGAAAADAMPRLGWGGGAEGQGAATAAQAADAAAAPARVAGRQAVAAERRRLIDPG